MMSSTCESAYELEQVFIYRPESSDINLSNPALCVVIDDDEPLAFPSAPTQSLSEDQFSLSPHVPIYHSIEFKAGPYLLDDMSVDYETSLNNADVNDCDNLSQNISSIQSLITDESVEWSYPQVIIGDKDDQQTSQTNCSPEFKSISDNVTCSQASTQPLSVASQEIIDSLSTIPIEKIPTCCRKHEKYIRRTIKAKRKDLLLINNDVKKRYPLEKLFEPSGGYMKPKYSHNMLCAFAIWAQENNMVEVSSIYKFLGECFPYFQTAEMHWKNSLRHSLATCEWFVKSEEHRTEKKGYKWTFNPVKIRCLNIDVERQKIRDLSKLNHCLANERVLELLGMMGLAELESASSSFIEASTICEE